jgi:hypothetical protein
VEQGEFHVPLRLDSIAYEKMLMTFLGPVELWRLSTTPGDTALRHRLYAAAGIDRRNNERLKRGELDIGAEAGMVNELAPELNDGKRLGTVLRDLAQDHLNRSSRWRPNRNVEWRGWVRSEHNEYLNWRCWLPMTHRRALLFKSASFLQAVR